MAESTSPPHDRTGLVPMPRPGDVVGGKYRIVRRLGEGGMGVVFEALHLRLRQSVAIKFLRPEVMRTPHAVERFEREARASGRVRSRHVVSVMDVDTDTQGRPYMVLELLRGRDLQAELRQRGPLPIPEAIDLILQACGALAEAHEAGIVHRDLKPSNLFLAEEGGSRIVKILDFGISKSAPDVDPSVTSAAVSVGTPLYMSPEQVRSSRDVDRRADVWSLGIILYELIAGAPPFSGTTTAAVAAIVADATPSLRAVRPEVPEALERVIAAALAKDRENRFPGTEAFGAALVRFASADRRIGPLSLPLRPSQQAFEIATATMARAPAGRPASDPSDLLQLPTARTTNGRQSGRYGLGLVGAIAAIVGFAAALASAGAPTTLFARAARTDRALTARAPVKRAMGSSHAVVAPPPGLGCAASLGSSHADCRNPSGSSGGGGREIRRSSEP
ncbi:MAG: serine/threonine-protein kinase [Polyangiaceae bacterium]